MIDLVAIVVLQYFAFCESADKIVLPSMLAFYLLTIGVIVYGMSLYHRAINHEFGGVYQFWSCLYLLLFGYIISFQALLPYLWTKEAIVSASSSVLLILVSSIGLVILMAGIINSARSKNIHSKEAIGFVLVVALLAILIGLTSFVADEDTGYGRHKAPSDISTKIWLFWIIDNIVFLGVILWIIFYGTWQKLPSAVNLGIFFFALDIITRYIGFIMDFWGYTSLSVIFITGGILLLFGGYFIEKFRRKLIAQTQVGTPALATKPARVYRKIRK
ncbi:hypothetical protein KY347_04895 [Candidatus Woesearchaeota archaeon]|nr:hypothetical protein [Candidatus Woesearchaeota archaeon]